MTQKEVNSEIIASIDDLRIERRWKHLLDFFEVIKNRYSWEQEVFINKTILTDVCWSYFIDIQRHKHFHGIDRVERYKISAFSTKWLMRLKPIQFHIDDPSDIDSKKYQYLNEIFSLRFGFAASNIPVEKITSKTVIEALYTFHYRTINEEMLTIWYKALGGSDDGFVG